MCIIKFINLHPNEDNQRLRYYSFRVNLDRFVRPCNTANDLPNTGCVRKKAEDLNIHVFDGNKWIKSFDKKYIIQLWI